MLSYFEYYMTKGYARSISLHHKINIVSKLFQIFHNFRLGISVQLHNQDVTQITEIRKVLNKLNFGATPPFPPKTTLGI